MIFLLTRIRSTDVEVGEMPYEVRLDIKGRIRVELTGRYKFESIDYRVE